MPARGWRAIIKQAQDNHRRRQIIAPPQQGPDLSTELFGVEKSSEEFEIHDGTLTRKVSDSV